MLSLTERISLARRHVATGQSIIVRQRHLIQRARNKRLDSSVSEELLTRFEQTQIIFENDLERLLRQQDQQ